MAKVPMTVGEVIVRLEFVPAVTPELLVKVKVVELAIDAIVPVPAPEIPVTFIPG